MADPELDPSVRQQLEMLNGNLSATDLGDEYDAFANMYDLLPEAAMSNVVGGDIIIDFDPEHPRMHVRPLAAFGGYLAVRDLSQPRASQDRPAYYFFRGSMFFPDGAPERHGPEAISQTALFLLTRGEPFKGSLDNGVSAAYNPYTFCRDGQLVYAPAFPVEQLRDPSIRTRAAANSLLGMLLTIQPVPNQPLTLFVESSYSLSPPIRQVRHRVGSNWRNLLSFVSDAPDRLHG